MYLKISATGISHMFQNTACSRRGDVSISSTPYALATFIICTFLRGHVGSRISVPVVGSRSCLSLSFLSSGLGGLAAGHSLALGGWMVKLGCEGAHGPPCPAVG